MALLLLKLETSGLIRRDLALGDAGQPWACSVALEHCEDDGTTINAVRALVRPDGRKVKAEASAKHGIDPAYAERKGLAEGAILSILADVAGKDRTATVVSYGDLDPAVIESLMVRLETKLGKPTGTFRNRWIRPGLQFVNIMAPAAQQACKLPSEREDGDYRWPSLDEAAAIILGEEPAGAHRDAWHALSTIKRLFFALRERGVLEVAAA